MSLNYEDIVSLVEVGTTYDKIGEKYGVSGSYIRKFLKNNGFILPKRRKVNELETFNRGRKLKNKKETKKKAEGKGKFCVVCGKELTGRQEKYCSIGCKRKQLSKMSYQTEYAKEKDRFGSLKKLEYIKEHGGGCSVCGYKKNLASLVFHHLRPEEKKFSITSRDFARRSKESLNEELEKCIIVCQNCHHELHHPDFNDLL